MSTPRALRDEPIPLRSDRAALLTSERRGLMRGLIYQMSRLLRAFAQARPAQQRVFRYTARPLSDGL